MLSKNLRADKLDDGAKLFWGILLLLTIPIVAIWRGFVLTKMWGWFITPFGVHQIGLAHAIGISLTASVFLLALKTREPERSDKSDRHKLIEGFVFAALGPPIFWLFGAIAHAFM